MNGRATARIRPRVTAITAAGLGLAVTILVAFVPGLQFAYRSSAGHLALENVDASIAALIAVLFYGRHRRSRSARDLLVSLAFALLSLTGVMLVLLPAFARHPGVVWTSWIPLVVRLFAAGMIALAASNPARRTDDRRSVLCAGGVAAAVLLGVILAGVLAGDRFPAPLNPNVSPASSHRPLLIGSPALLAAQAAHAFLYAVAAMLFVVQAERTRDELTSWLGVGCVLAAFARVNYFLFPSLYSQWLYVGDFLRTGFYLVLGYGALRELQSYWQLHSEAAVFAERRRLARDLHDGTVQELGYIRAVARRAAGSPLDTATADRIGAAAERALAEARQAIAALSMPLDEPLEDVLRRAAEEMADRYDVHVQVSAIERGDLERDKRDAVVRVVREAVSNAARHAQAGRIDVRVAPGCVEVHDDGKGFDPHSVSDGGFGLVSMRERAEAVGARFELTSAAGAGTTVRMEWDAKLD